MPKAETPRASLRPDLAIAAVLFAIGAVAGMVYQSSWGGLPQFWQNTTFMQAIMWNCGHGFTNPMVSDVPNLEPFLDYEVDCFDCANVPDDVRLLPADTSGMTFKEIDAYHPQHLFPGFIAWQNYHRYLVLSVMVSWWLFGLCWSSLTPLAGVLHGISAAAGYGVFRLGLRRGWAAFAAFLLTIAPLQVQMLPHLRDYSKAPFFLLAIFLTGLLVRHTFRRTSFVALCTLTGAVIGIGFGFRTDLAIALPAFLFTVIALVPGRIRDTWKTRLVGSAGCVLAFTVIGWPVLKATFQESGHFCHVTSLGLLEYCNHRLGVGATLYHLGDPFTDYYLSNVAQAYVHRLGEPMPETTLWKPEYHQATQRFFIDYVLTFPADMLLRAYTAVLRVLDELQINPDAPYPRNITNTFVQRLYDLRFLLVDNLPGSGRYYAAATLLLIAAVNLRWAFAAAFVLCYFAGYPALQFNVRHAFYLEIFNLWATVFLLQFGVRGAVWCWIRRRRLVRALAERWQASGRAALTRSIAFALAVTAIVVLPILALRVYQHRQVDALVRNVLAKPAIPLKLSAETQPDALRRFDTFARYNGPPESQAGLPVYYAYLRLDVSGPEGRAPIRLVYEAENEAHYDFSRTIAAPVRGPDAAPTRCYIPLYFSEDARFQGIVAPPEYTLDAHAVALSLPPSLLMTLIVPPDWETLPRHQTLTR